MDETLKQALEALKEASVAIQIGHNSLVALEKARAAIAAIEQHKRQGHPMTSITDLARKAGPWAYAISAYGHKAVKVIVRPDVADEFASNLRQDGVETDIVPLYPATTVAALQARVAELEKDAERYRWLRNQTGGARDIRSKCKFILPEPHPIGDIMKGSVAQHLDAAIDEALRSKK